MSHFATSGPPVYHTMALHAGVKLKGVGSSETVTPENMMEWLADMAPEAEIPSG